MIIKSIKIKNYRNLSDIFLEADQSMNVICGDNAQGKTNIIEAIWNLTGAKSFRNAKESEMVMFGKEKALISAEISSFGTESEIKIETADKKAVFINGKKSPNTALFEKFSAIVFSPSDINLILGEPNVRRRFLDVSICQIYPKYINYLRDYNRAIIQRNSILKDCLKDASLKLFLDDFEKSIINNGEKIIEYRKRYLKKLMEFAPEIYLDLSGKKENLEIEYISSIKESFEKELKEKRSEDILRGSTGIGPHRDDCLFLINKKAAREFSSQGQKRSIALTLKLASAEILKEVTGEQPVALLDDVMSELDKTRQEYILNHIKNWQVFLTCCEKAHFENLKKGKIFTVKNGEVT